MLLVVDVGNTNIAVGAYEKDDLQGSWRLNTDIGQTSDEYGVQIVGFLQQAGLEPSQCQDVIISSVVPPLARAMDSLSAKYLGHKPILIDPHKVPGVAVEIDRPEEVGADRVVNTAAAYVRHGGPCIVIDFGTATTFDVVSAQGNYSGGAIAPGLGLATEALVAHASRLYRVEFVPPATVVGKSTIHAMQSGIMLGYLSLVEGMIRRFHDEIGACKVVATGGFASLFAQHTSVIDSVDPNLTLEGLRIIYERLK
jgi:type III pantothenate kinase